MKVSFGLQFVFLAVGCLALVSCDSAPKEDENIISIEVVPPDVTNSYLKDVSDISVGNSHSCAISDGKLFCWGLGNDGQLGKKNNLSSKKPTHVKWDVNNIEVNFVNASAIEAAGSSSCALRNGVAFCWGSNNDSQLGDGSVDNHNTPTMVGGLTTGITNITIGRQHGCAIENGGVKCWGSNTYSQIGDGTSSRRSTPVSVTDTNLGNAVMISAGYLHTCAISNGRIYCWGRGQEGQLGDGTINDRSFPVSVSGNGSFSLVSAGEKHTCAIKNGGAYCWGNGTKGRLGDNNNEASSPSPVEVSDSEEDINMQSGITHISASKEYSCAVASGALLCWGRGTEGQLGNNSTENSLIPVKVLGLNTGVTAVATGDNSACAVKMGYVWCWGAGAQGQLGNNLKRNSLIPVAVITPTNDILP